MSSEEYGDAYGRGFIRTARRLVTRPRGNFSICSLRRGESSGHRCSVHSEKL
jgi:hypothetical protein